MWFGRGLGQQEAVQRHCGCDAPNHLQHKQEAVQRHCGCDVTPDPSWVFITLWIMENMTHAENEEHNPLLRMEMLTPHGNHATNTNPACRANY